MPTMTVLLAEVYVADESIREEGTDALDPYWLEGVPARVEVCAEDGQIRLGVTLDDVYSEVVGL